MSSTHIEIIQEAPIKLVPLANGPLITDELRAKCSRLLVSVHRKSIYTNTNAIIYNFKAADISLLIIIMI